jgi:hypothetical protein
LLHQAGERCHIGFDDPIRNDRMRREREMSDIHLILLVTATYAGAIGFADVFECRVQKLIAGNLQQDAIKLTILPSDKDRLQVLSAHPPPHEIEIGFAIAGKNEPYGVAPVSGFVDRAGTSWQVMYMHEP